MFVVEAKPGSCNTNVPATYKLKIINEINTLISLMRRYQNGDIDLFGVIAGPLRKRLRSIIVASPNGVKRRCIFYVIIIGLKHCKLCEFMIGSILECA